MNGISFSFNDINYDERRKDQKYSMTRMEKDEIIEMRRSRMSKSERVREWTARHLRGPLLFGVPILLSLIMVIVLVIIYIIRPYALTKDFTKTHCKVTGYEIMNGSVASCSAGTDPFQPCIQVKVSYPTKVSQESGIIMENEQALANCNPCSYTFGHHGLFHEYQDVCESWRENYDPAPCVEHFLSNYGIIGSSYTCYFNPHDKSQVVRDLTLDLNLLIHSFSWPVLACLAYLLIWAFVSYDSKQLSLLDQCIFEEILYQKKQQEIARIKASQWRRGKLSQSLGIMTHADGGLRNGGMTSFLGSFSNHTRHLSSSLPSLNNFQNEDDDVITNDFVNTTDNIDDLPFEIDAEEECDLRHLDLAVSQKNINDLSTSFPYMHTPSPLMYSNQNGTDGNLDITGAGHTHQTLPVLTSFQGGNDGRHRKWKVLSNGTLPDGRSCSNDIRKGSLGNVLERSYFSSTKADDDDVGISEDEIDYYFSIISKNAKRKRNISLEENGGMQFVNMFTAKDESQV